MKQSKLLLASVILALMVRAPTAVGQVAELVIFGDSLSDSGNVNQLTFGLVPSDDYYNSRVFSNGAPWVSHLAEGLGVVNPDHSLAGTATATNFAYGGAKSGEGSESFSAVAVRNVAQQIDEFVDAGRQFSDDSLVALWIGGNDLNGTSASNASSQISATIANVRDHLEELIELGARQFLIPNIPPLGEVPQHNGTPSERSQQNELTASYNLELASLIAALRSENATTQFVELDVARSVGEVLGDPGAFGFVNTTDQAHTPGFFGFGGSTVDNPNSYVFWDDLHPTGPVHRIFGERAVVAVTGLALPSVQGIAIDGVDTIISFFSREGERYYIDRSPDLANWERVVANLEGKDGQIEAVHSGGFSGPQAYYRIGIE